MTEKVNKYRPMPMRMSATAADFIATMRMATTNTSSIDHLPIVPTRWFSRRTRARSCSRSSQMTPSRPSFTSGKMIVKTVSTENRKYSRSW